MVWVGLYLIGMIALGMYICKDLWYDRWRRRK